MNIWKLCSYGYIVTAVKAVKIRVEMVVLVAIGGIVADIPPLFGVVVG